MLTLYLMEVTPLLKEENFHRALELVDRDRRERVLRIRQEKNRALSLGAGLLLSFAVSGYRQENAGKLPEESMQSPDGPQGKPLVRTVEAEWLLSDGYGTPGLIPPSSLQLYRTPAGKPYFADQPGLFFSLSHSGTYALCVLSDREVGADIQIWRSFSAGNLVDKVLHETEREVFASRKPAEQQEIFFSLWAAKEAYVKYTGEGLSKKLGALQADLGAGTVTDTQTGQQGRLWLLSLLSGYAVAVCEAL